MRTINRRTKRQVAFEAELHGFTVSMASAEASAPHFSREEQATSDAVLEQRMRERSR